MTNQTPPAGPFGFDEALRQMKAGKAMRRQSWRQGLEICLVIPDNVFIQSSTSGAWVWHLDNAAVLAEDWQVAPARA